MSGGAALRTAQDQPGPVFAGPGGDGLIRMTYSQNDDGSVRQHGEASFDHGLTWVDSFDFTYRRASD